MITLFANLLLSTGAIVLLGLMLVNLATRVLPKPVLCFWSWPGTAVHELSHAAACFPAMAQIKSVTLFRADGSGEVVHGEPKLKLLGMILISLAPLAGGLVAIALINWLFGSPMTYGSTASGRGEELFFLWHAFTAALSDVFGILDFDQLGNWKFWVVLLLGSSISLRMIPSGQDFSNCASSLAVFLGIVLLWLLFTSLVGLSDLGVRWGIHWLLSHVHLIFAFMLVNGLILGSIGLFALFVGD